MSIKTAAVSMEMPAAIEKKETMEAMSRMVVKEAKGTLQHGPDLGRLSLLFAIIRWPAPKEKTPLPVVRNAKDIS